MRRLWFAAQVVLAGAVLYFVGHSMARNWDDIRRSGAVISVDPAALAVSAGITLATYALLISAWRAVLLGWGERLPYPRAARIWCVSNLARYVPGRIWQVAGMAAMAQRAGISPWAAAGSAVVVQLLAVATGALVTGIAAPHAGKPLLVAGAGIAAAALAAALAWPPATRLLSSFLRRLSGRDLRLEPVAPGPLLLSTAVTTLAWVAYGLALYFFVQGVLGEARLSVFTAVGAFTASYLVGLLLVFTPGGLGAREGTIYVLLVGPLGPAGAFVVMAGSRVLMTATELLAALVMLPVRARDGADAVP
jgi:hypothetical protein